jgi:hypothetical protein
MRKYDLAKMLEEIRLDEGAGPKPAPKHVLTQAEIKALARARPKPAREKPPAE